MNAAFDPTRWLTEPRADFTTKEPIAEIGERLTAQFAELSARPSRDGCDHVLRSLTEASTAVARMRTRLEREQAA